MGTHPEHKPIVSLDRWHRLLTAAPADLHPHALAVLPPRQVISDRFRRVHLEGDRAQPIGYVGYHTGMSSGQRMVRAVIGGFGIGALILICAVLA